MRERRRPLEGVEHDQQLHQVLVHRRAGGLDDEDVRAADVLLDLAVVLAVGEVVERDPPGLAPEVPADLARQRRMGAAAEDLQLTVREAFHRSLSERSGWGGRIRTSEWRFQRPLTYHLSTPHPEASRGLSRRRRSSALLEPDRSRAARELGPGDGFHDRHPRLRLDSEPLERSGRSQGLVLRPERPEDGRAAPGEPGAAGPGSRERGPDAAQFPSERLRRRLEIVPVRPATGVGARKL